MKAYDRATIRGTHWERLCRYVHLTFHYHTLFIPLFIITIFSSHFSLSHSFHLIFHYHTLFISLFIIKLFLIGSSPRLEGFDVGGGFLSL